MEEQALILIKRVCTISEPIYAFDKCRNNNKDFRETSKRARTNVRLRLVSFMWAYTSTKRNDHRFFSKFSKDTEALRGNIQIRG